MIITLIGYRGTGKSTLAPALANRLGMSWVDADLELERRAGCSIRDIFANQGEPAFRSLERAVLVDLLKSPSRILAAGGGAILNPETRRDFQAAGPVVWLTASPESIFERLQLDPKTAAQRPNLTATGGIEEIRSLLAVREPLYRECATITVSTERWNVAELVEEIWQKLHRKEFVQ